MAGTDASPRNKYDTTKIFDINSLKEFASEKQIRKKLTQMTNPHPTPKQPPPPARIRPRNGELGTRAGNCQA